MKRIPILILISIVSFLSVWAVAPAGYYQQCEGKSGQNLLKALYSTISSHTTVSYDGLWNVYKTSDIRDNGTVWDMYSTKEWRVGQEKCGNYKNVGDCINREHSFPKSWFNDKTPMYSDAFHIYPTDGKVNGQRSNYPFGECAGGTTLPSNGNVKALGKLGSCTFPGYSDKVFEPVDEYKGDFARSYFYMAACYNNQVSTWSSPMLAGNSYPVFSSWAVNLLLKWHRQDPVSKKETDRNDAVYAHQRNRNPFIDHPELVEYIWGDKKTQAWTSGGSIEPELIAPVNGTTVNVGITGLGVERSISIPVKGKNITSNVSVSVSGAGFSISNTTLSAELVNAGRAGVIVSYVSNAVADSHGTLTLTSGSAKSTVSLTAQAVDGLPASPATDVTETSFIARWANIDGDGATYSLMLYLNGIPVNGYPISVPAEDEWILIDNLEPDSQYAYELSNGTLTSNRVNVHTAAPIPSIQFLFDGELEFTTRSGEPSDIAELLLDIENITGDIVVTVAEPFEVSTDKADWNRSVTIAEGEDRMYLRLYGEIAGTYTTTLSARAGDYLSDDATATGTITGACGFLETFETVTKVSYDNGLWTGVTGKWYLVNAGVFQGDSNGAAYEGELVLRFGKNSNSSIAMSEHKAGGIGVVSLFARAYGSDGEATIKIQYSADGETWNDAETITVSGTVYKEYKATVNQSGNQYVRLQQTAGKRVLIDNIALSDYSAVGAVDELYYHSWDAYCRDHKLVIENKKAGEMFHVYGMDGIEYLGNKLPEGETHLQLPTGLYIVVSADFSRRVLVK